MTRTDFELFAQVDEDGFVALVCPGVYAGYVGEDWTLAEITGRFLQQMNARALFIAYPGSDFAGEPLRISNRPSAFAATREATSVLQVEDDGLWLSDYSQLSMAAQFSDTRPVAYYHTPVPVSAGAYLVTIRQVVDPPLIELILEHPEAYRENDFHCACIVSLHDDRELSRDLLRRAKAAGYSAIVFTIDAFAPGASDETIRQAFSFPPSLPLVNSKTGVFKSSLGWDDVDFIQQATDLPVILKGVVTPQIAEEAIKRGVAALQVSNHGGRGLDGVPAAISLLPGVVKAAKGRVPVLMDSGIRRGTDVFKALALGADAVALGRPVLYGLSLGGAEGVQSVYDRIKAELARAMMIAGVASIKEIDEKFLYDKSSADKA